MAHQFSEGQRVKVLEDGQLDDGVKQYRGRIGTVDHIVESTPKVIFYSVAFSGSWERGYIREEALEAVGGDPSRHHRRMRPEQEKVTAVEPKCV